MKNNLKEHNLLMKNIHKILNFCIIPTFLRRYDFSILTLGKSSGCITKYFYKKDFVQEWRNTRGIRSFT